MRVHQRHELLVGVHICAALGLSLSTAPRWRQLRTSQQLSLNTQQVHLVWTYNVKALDGRKKARCVCDGSSRSGSVQVLDETYANCVDQTSSRLFYAIAATENLLVCNAFAEAPPPKQGF